MFMGRTEEQAFSRVDILSKSNVKFSTLQSENSRRKRNGNLELLRKGSSINHVDMEGGGGPVSQMSILLHKPFM